MAKADPDAVVAELETAGGSVKEQQAKFMIRTGLGPRIFVNYRAKLGLEKRTQMSRLSDVVRQ